jgi:hypothetical protein
MAIWASGRFAGGFLTSAAWNARLATLVPVTTYVSEWPHHLPRRRGCCVNDIGSFASSFIDQTGQRMLAEKPLTQAENLQKTVY